MDEGKLSVFSIASIVYFSHNWFI